MKHIGTFIFTTLATLLTVTSCNDCDCELDVCKPTQDETMFQVATLQSLMVGNYDGFITVDELRKHGNIGLGTFENVDGEMIVINDTVYQARYDGSVSIASPNTTVPFATVTHFDADTTIAINNINNINELTTHLNTIVNKLGKNIIYVIRMEIAHCDSVKVRSELPQKKPFRPLAEALATDQREYTYTNTSGTIVAVYFPDFFNMQNTPGWHYHFITADRSKGGHMLNIVCNTKTEAVFDATPYYTVYMPYEKEFSQRDLSEDLSEDIEKVEK